MSTRSLPRTALVLILTAGLLLTVSGCWDKRELDELIHVVSLYLDLDEGMLRVTGEVLTGAGQPDQAAPSGHAIVTGRGASFTDALWNIRLSSKREIYVAHVDYIVFGEELARAGLLELVQALTHNYQIRSHVYVAATGGKASDLLSARILETRHAEMFLGMLDTAARTGANGGTSTLLDLQRSLANSREVDPLLARIILLPPPPVAHAAEQTQAGMDTQQGGGTQGGGGGEQAGKGEPVGAVNGAALFEGDRLVAFLEEAEARGLQWVMSHARDRTIWVPVEGGGGFGLRVSASKFQIRAEQDALGRLQVHLKIVVEADVQELAGLADTDGPERLAQAEALTARYIEAEVAAGLAYVGMLRTDPVGIGRHLARWHPEQWSRFREEWPGPLEDASYDIKAEVRIITTGVLKKKAPGSD